MARHAQPIETKRRKPRQNRSTQTVAAILEAAAQVLDAGGMAAFTTNAVAERAGVSIGTLYQYFADKNALMRALAAEETRIALANVASALAGGADGSVEGRVRAMVRAIVHAFRGRQRARRAVLQAILAQGAGTEMMAPIATFIARVGDEVGRAPGALLHPLTREQVFVLSRSLMGTIRAAVLEEQPFFRSQAFEDEIVRMVVAYLGAVSMGAGRQP